MDPSLRALLLLSVLVVSATAAERPSSSSTTDDSFFNNPNGFLPSLLRGIGGSIGGTIGRISQYNWSSLWNNQTANMIMRDDHEQSKCYDDIGCVNYTESWYHSLYRPVNFFPLERHLIPTRFWVHTRPQPDTNVTITAGDDDSVTRAGFDAQRDTKFIIHGFLDTGTDDWVRDMAQRLLDYGDFNVIAVDWRYGALPMYQQALSNTQLVAMETAHLIKWLQASHGLNVSRVHVIGHSLGAQTAGYIGSRVPGLARITGLDPAEPGFQYMAPEVRLDPGDAEFVDVIHSDVRGFISTGLGMLQPCGHLDFYPNGGNDQPGCNSYTHTLTAFLENSMDDFESELLACRHIRAVRIFTDSIIENPDCTFVGHECKNFDEFMKGECGTCGKNGEHCASMGYHADKYPYKNKTLVPFYLTTSSKALYCLRHYRINIELADLKKDQREVKGHLVLSMFGPKGRLERYRLPKKGAVALKHGQTYRYIVQTAKSLGPVHRVQLSWEKERPSLLQVPCLIWCPDASLMVAQVTLLDMDQFGSDEDTAQTFCPSAGDHVRIQSGKERVTMYNQSSCSDAQTRESAAAFDFSSGQESTTHSRLPFRLPFSPVAAGGRRQQSKLDRRALDGGGRRLHRLVSLPAGERRNWLLDIINFTRNL